MLVYFIAKATAMGAVVRSTRCAQRVAHFRLLERIDLVTRCCSAGYSLTLHGTVQYCTGYGYSGATRRIIKTEFIPIRIA